MAICITWSQYLALAEYHNALEATKRLEYAQRSDNHSHGDHTWDFDIIVITAKIGDFRPLIIFSFIIYSKL